MALCGEPSGMFLGAVRDMAFWGESIKPSIDSIIKRLVRVGARLISDARG